MKRGVCWRTVLLIVPFVVMHRNQSHPKSWNGYARGGFNVGFAI